MKQTDPRLLDHFETPALLISGGQVRFANAAAREVLGAHVIGQDPRIAIRDPKVVALLSQPNDGSVTVDGLSVRGSRWKVSCHVLDGGARLLVMDDLSVRVSVARAHADFVANASHELRTPLAAILGYVETLDDSKAGADEATRKRFLGIIRHEARRMQALIEDLMSLSRIEAVKHDAPTAPVDLVALARECVGEVGERGKVTITTNTEAAQVAGDRGQLAQVVRNLIDNAIKYGKPGGDVAVMIEVTPAGRVALSVHDEGDGIAPEHLPRLTERFYRADASRSRAAGGTGLGLAIVKHIVERHRGRFDIASRSGEGTVATLILPLLP
ncbi:cell wall metabolism sensor histidine kinase WalK [Novosphingobium sp.]|uniref:sensor histidine kinase n=1 Tax=Novosphingobium sp. TaxID=1874826 RepID=UPI00273314B6|nr:ATP-binding protein [Novosphingobium sp.]MDP3906562.1 ATP-binding protein [Novosphingobium sp.]